MLKMAETKKTRMAAAKKAADADPRQQRLKFAVNSVMTRPTHQAGNSDMEDVMFVAQSSVSNQSSNVVIQDIHQRHMTLYLPAAPCICEHLRYNSGSARLFDSQQFGNVSVVLEDGAHMSEILSSTGVKLQPLANLSTLVLSAKIRVGLTVILSPVLFGVLPFLSLEKLNTVLAGTTRVVMSMVSDCVFQDLVSSHTSAKFLSCCAEPFKFRSEATVVLHTRSCIEVALQILLEARTIMKDPSTKEDAPLYVLMQGYNRVMNLARSQERSNWLPFVRAAATSADTSYADIASKAASETVEQHGFVLCPVSDISNSNVRDHLGVGGDVDTVTLQLCLESDHGYPLDVLHRTVKFLQRFGIGVTFPDNPRSMQLILQTRDLVLAMAASVAVRTMIPQKFNSGNIYVLQTPIIMDLLLSERWIFEQAGLLIVATEACMPLFLHRMDVFANILSAPGRLQQSGLGVLLLQRFFICVVQLECLTTLSSHASSQRQGGLSIATMLSGSATSHVAEYQLSANFLAQLARSASVPCIAGVQAWVAMCALIASNPLLLTSELFLVIDTTNAPEEFDPFDFGIFVHMLQNQEATPCNLLITQPSQFAIWIILVYLCNLDAHAKLPASFIDSLSLYAMCNLPLDAQAELNSCLPTLHVHHDYVEAVLSDNDLEELAASRLNIYSTIQVQRPPLHFGREADRQGHTDGIADIVTNTFHEHATLKDAPALHKFAGSAAQYMRMLQITNCLLLKQSAAIMSVQEEAAASTRILPQIQEADRISRISLFVGSDGSNINPLSVLPVVLGSSIVVPPMFEGSGITREMLGAASLPLPMLNLTT